MPGGEIRELDERTVERIAAGEVVERPASAVKELVENSIDADASRVTVAVEAGGTELIRVTDDGVGMSEEQLRRAVEQHTTSKIRDIDDLEGGVGTLGFRGEALHAIGAVSRMTVRSRPRGGGRGTELTVEGGDVTEVSPAGCPEGTTVELQDLFYNVPARRKYLKTETTEFGHVSTVVTNYALANPDVAVTLEHDGRETFATTGSGDLREAVLSVYGREVAESMIPVEVEATEEGPLADIAGLVSHPETTRASREYLSTFVNGRYVTAGTVREAVVDAYGGQLAADRYPFAVLFLSVDPASVDVNVHPRKREVRFADSDGVREQVRTAVESALLDAGLVRSSAPRGRSAPEQTEIRPTGADAVTAAPAEEPHDDRVETGETPDESEEPAAGTDAVTADSADGEPTDVDPTEAATGTEPTDPEPTGAATGTEPADSESTAAAARSEQTETATDPEAGGATAGPDSAGRTGPAPSTTPPRESTSETGSRSAEKSDKSRTAPTGGPETQVTLHGDETDRVTEYDTLPTLRVLGQLDDTYLVAEAADGLVLIDQHAADERVNYERLRAQFEGSTTTQALADPVELELTAREAATFDASSDALARLGFHAERIDDRTVRVSTVPAVVADSAGPALIRDVLGDLVADEGTAEETVESVADDLLADMACHPSIKGNTSLTEGSVVELLSALDGCENPWACPHGRPVLIQIDSEEIDDRFERDYPGH